MGGSGYRCGGGTLFCAEPGTSGHTLHDGNEAKQWNRGYDFKNGRSYCETVTVAWQLRDVEAGMGGFVSHTAFAPFAKHSSNIRRNIGNSDELGLLARLRPAFPAATKLNTQCRAAFASATTRWASWLSPS